MCVFQWKTGHISEIVRDMAKITINQWWIKKFVIGGQKGRGWCLGPPPQKF